MTDPQLIFKRLISDNENERKNAANLLYQWFTKDGGHPDDWIIREKSGDSLRRVADMEAGLRKTAEEMRKYAESDAVKERKARAKADAENAKLRDQLEKAREAKAAPDPSACVDLLSGLLYRRLWINSRQSRSVRRCKRCTVKGKHANITPQRRSIW
jgi:hypothetical protein